MKKIGQASGARARLLEVCSAMLLGLVAGCSRGPEFADVEGVVILDGRPLDGVEVVFVPDAEKGNNGPRASAFTDDQGRYKLHSDRVNKGGAVVGLHRICIRDVTYIAAVGLPVMRGSRPPAELTPPDAQAEKAKRSRVPPAYTSPTDTPLHIEVKPGRQTHNIEIKSGLRR
jgi:hypothetical protein